MPPDPFMRTGVAIARGLWWAKAAGRRRRGAGSGYADAARRPGSGCCAPIGPEAAASGLPGRPDSPRRRDAEERAGAGAGRRFGPFVRAPARGGDPGEASGSGAVYRQRPAARVQAGHAAPRPSRGQRVWPGRAHPTDHPPDACAERADRPPLRGAGAARPAGGLPGPSTSGIRPSWTPPPGSVRWSGRRATRTWRPWTRPGCCARCAAEKAAGPGTGGGGMVCPRGKVDR